MPEKFFDGFPKGEVYFGHGQKPPQQAAPPLGERKPSPETHKYRLMASEPVINKAGGKLWLVDSTKFPISTTMAGAILELETGAMRELHWHPNSDEWQYVLSGKVSVTLFGANGRYRTETLDAGDVGYIPQGYGHSIENVAGGASRVLIGFNSGIYQDIDLSEWMLENPPDILATNFGKPAALFEKFPREDVFIAPQPGAEKGKK